MHELKTSYQNIRVPVGGECTVSENLSRISGYNLSSYKFSDAQNVSFQKSSAPISFTSKENSDYSLQIINARYNTTVSWTVKWVDNNAFSGRDPHFTLMYSLDGDEPIPLDESSLGLFGLEAVPQAVCSNPYASNNYRYFYSGLPNVVDGKTVTYTVTEEAANYICKYDSDTDTFINTLTYIKDESRMIFRNFVPVVKDGQTVAVLYGVVDLQTLPEQIKRNV